MMQPITSLSIKNKRVILRADLNAPIKDGHFIEDYRLKEILPTIDYIQSQDGKVILLTHLGRPTNNDFDPNLSTRLVSDWLEKNNYIIDYEIDLMKAIEKSNNFNNSILVLENLRFFKGEKEANANFAQLLSKLGDCYVNDAFGLVHRHDTSITLLPQQFNFTKRAYGLLIEKEIKELKKLKINPEQPFVVMLGGCKLEDKIEIIEGLVKQENSCKVKTIFIGGLISQIFLAAQGKIPIPQQHKSIINLCHKIINTIKESNVKLELPEDFIVKTISSTETVSVASLKDIESDSICIDIGPQTIQNFTKKLSDAKTIFVNGTMGIYEDNAASLGTKSILLAVSKTTAHRVIGGGDAVAATFLFNLDQKMNYLSTGGGATLAFIASKNPECDLPGFQALSE